jgi:hypothetical protein
MLDKNSKSLWMCKMINIKKSLISVGKLCSAGIGIHTRHLLDHHRRYLNDDSLVGTDGRMSTYMVVISAKHLIMPFWFRQNIKIVTQ